MTAALLLLSALALPTLACAQDAAQSATAEAALRAGRYAEAVEIGRRAVERDPADARSRRALVDALMETGRYEEAEAAAAPLPNALGEVLYARGRVPEAETAFRRAVQQGGADRLQAELNLAVLLFNRGERDPAMDRFDRFVDVYNRSDRLSAADLVSVGTAVRYLGTQDPQLFHDAIKAYTEATAADPGDPEPRLLSGELLLEKYQSSDAQAAFREVLAINPSHPRALLGLARAKEFDGEPGEAFELVRRALEINPSSVAGRVMLARLHLGSESTAEAEAELNRALEVNPSSLEALSLLAAYRYLQGDQGRYQELRGRVLKLNPRYDALYTTLAEMAANRRRYADAADLATEALHLDPSSWTARSLLGINQLRLGRIDDARGSLQQAFTGDPFNVWTKNTLDLLDTFSQYEVRRTPHFEFMLHGQEAELLFPYMAALAEESYESLAKRYGYQPPTPVRIEVYPSHADFSVRTVGLTGLGALGVAFGNVLALDSPAAREAGELNWGSTLWHELAHAVTLGLSNNRVPRWLTEGLSVLEERRARPGWGSETSASFLTAYAAGEIPPVSRLNEGFTRPKTPQHIMLAYHMASLVLEWVEEKHGFAAIPRMLRAYGEGGGDEQVFRSVLRSDPATVDREFDAWLRARYPAERTAEYVRRRTEAVRALEAGELDAARRALEAAAQLLPDGDEVPALLAQLRLRQNDARGAAEALSRVAALDENAYEANLKLAELLEQQGDHAGAAAALERVIYIYPYDAGMHTRLAALYARLGDRDKVVRERRAVVALRPVDRAEALYQLALALHEAGRRDEARAEVLRALEVAPGFERAQELLLRLREAGGTE